MCVLIATSSCIGQNLTLRVKGKDSIESKVIDSIGYLKLHENYISLKYEVDTLQKQLYKIGYIANKRLSFKKVNDSAFTAKLHLKQKTDHIDIYFNTNVIDQTLIDVIAENSNATFFSLKLTKVEDALSYLNSELANQGLPFSKLKLANIRTADEGNLKADLVIDNASKKRVINAIKVEGYNKFPKSYLKHYLKLKTSQVFDLSKIREKAEQLANLRFASQVKPAEVLFKEDSTTLYLYIKKSKSNTFDGFLGFGTDEETNNIQFDGFLNLKLINNLNFGETFSLLYKSDENDQETFDVGIGLPYLFNSPLGLDVNLRIFRRDSSFSTVDQKLKINYQINPLHKVAAGVSSTQSTNLRAENFITDLEDFSTSYFSLGYTYLKPQYYNILFPIKSNFSIETNFGTRTATSSETQQSLVFLKAFHNFDLNKRNSVYLNADAANLTSDDFFENELQRFGGINSIRGFEENSLLASLFAVLNTEYRYKVSNSIYIHSITDVAYFENNISNAKEKLISYGFGFGVLTKSGLLKFNFANGKNENQRFRFSNSKIHLSLVASF